MEIGKKIKEIRLAKGISQKELSKRLGVSSAMISQYESGKRTPKIETIKKISQALEISPYKILGSEQAMEDIRIFNQESNEKMNQALNSLKDETVFCNYLLSLGYQYVDNFHDNNEGYDRCIHVLKDKKDIPLTKDEYEYLKADIKEDVDKEIRTLRRRKNI